MDPSKLGYIGERLAFFTKDGKDLNASDPNYKKYLKELEQDSESDHDYYSDEETGQNIYLND